MIFSFQFFLLVRNSEHEIRHQIQYFQIVSNAKRFVLVPVVGHLSVYTVSVWQRPRCFKIRFKMKVTAIPICQHFLQYRVSV